MVEQDNNDDTQGRNDLKRLTTCGDWEACKNDHDGSSGGGDGGHQYYKRDIHNSKNVSDASNASRRKNNLVSISEGLDFMMWHFEEPLWPRNISTSATKNCQKPLHDRERALLYYQGAMREDCRIALYPNYEEMAKMGLLSVGFRPRPTHLFIDLDVKEFNNDIHELDKGLKSTLKNIRRQFKEEGVVPTINWSGGGYHIHLPLDPTAVLVYEEMEEFKRYDQPSVWFMRYAEQVLSKGQADYNHRTSFKSAMARVPGSRNSKYEDEAESQVRIIQRWNGVRAKPSEEFMLSDFLTWLVQQEFRSKKRMGHRYATRFLPSSCSCDSSRINWIENILQTPIPDYRKATVALILAPYLLKVRKMSNEQAFYGIKEWSYKCTQISPLRPTERDFMQKVRDSLQRAQSSPYFPMGFSRLVRDYPYMYQTYTKYGLKTTRFHHHHSNNDH